MHIPANPSSELLKKLERQLADDGRIIEAGWIGLRAVALSSEAPQVQIDEMRSAFFAGAAHLFATIMSVLDEDAEPTADDMRRMTLINDELQKFIAEFELRHGATKGNG